MIGAWVITIIEIVRSLSDVGNFEILPVASNYGSFRRARNHY